MDVNFDYVKPADVEPIYIEQIFAEKPGGGLVVSGAYDIKPSTAVGYNAEGKLVAIKGYRLVDAVTAEDTTIKIVKGSGVEVGDVIANAKKGVACTAVDTSRADYDTVTVTMGVAIKAGTCLYQAKSAGSSAVPFVTPEYVVGGTVPANKGDYPVRLINGANLRKETAVASAEVVALLPTIKLV